MGTGVSTDQGSFLAHGIRDVSEEIDRKQHDWSQLAEEPITKQPNTLSTISKPYSGAANVGLKSITDGTDAYDAYSGIQIQHRKSSVMEDDTQSGVFSNTGLRNRKLPTIARKNSSPEEDGDLKTEERRQKSEDRRKKTKGIMQVELETGQTAYIQVEPDTG